MTVSIKNVVKNAYDNWKEKNFAVEKSDGRNIETTYGDFLKKVDGVASGLIGLGLEGKNVVLISENSVDFCVADLAITAFVGTVVNVSCQTKSQELAQVIKVTKSSAVVYGGVPAPEIEKIRTSFPDVMFLPLGETVGCSCPGEKLFDFDEKDENVCSKIIFSSGTTSEPKGIMLSVKNIFYGRKYLQMRAPFFSTDVMFLCLPLHHTYANVCLLYYTLLSGLCLYFCSDKSAIARELLEIRPDLFCGVPMIYRKLYEVYGDRIGEAFGKNIRYMFSSGAKFDPELRRIYKQAGLPLVEAYAQTETASAFSIEYPNFDDFDSAGTVFEDLDVKIKNPNENGEGDIAVKGDNVFLGYVNNEKLTASVFDGEGYFLTNDVGYLKDGKLYIVGRKGDVMIGENGENVYPREIEKQLRSLSDDVVKLQSGIVDNKLYYNIFVKEGADLDVEELVEKYNSSATKKDMIKFFEITFTNKDNMKG
ncbi:MAG: AMP-binding protein [Clostridia bacterium]|nr:AMP-binding protein [Clostridia bacterium]